MEPKLPQGLVSVSNVPSSEILQQDILSSSVYKSLWQVYYTSCLASNDETEHRLEHLFWRIWSNKRLSSQMNTSTLDRLILRIKSPERLVGHQTMSPLPEGDNHKPTEEIKPCEAGSCSIHPILKKPKPTQVESHKNTRLLLDTPIGTKITLNPSNSPTASIASPIMISPTKASPTKSSLTKSSPPIPDNTSRQAPKKTYLAATRTGRGPRRRPFNRRKSSQTSIPKTPITAQPARRRSEPAAKTEAADAMYEDSYVELGLLQHLSFRDEEDEIARGLGREIAPEPKPVKPYVPLFDEDFIDDIPEDNTKTAPVPFPRASTLRQPMISPGDFGRIRQSFDAQDLGLPDDELDVDGDWTDVDAIDSTLPVPRPFKNLVEHRENIAAT